MKNFSHRATSVFVLLAILLLGAGLRFWHLDTKPLWLDEVLTALFSLGRSYRDVPTHEFLPLTALDSIFTYRPGLSCAQVAQTVAIESVHPPLFFCLMYQWMGWLHPDDSQWVWMLRSLPALLGVGAIAAFYVLNRIAFSPVAGWVGAALMAVSPFAVYLSQEARHYTLPMFLITLGLVGLVQIQRQLSAPYRLRPAVWVGWAAVNLLSLYTHYFCILSVIAQVVALLSWLLWRSPGHPLLRLPRRVWGAIALSLTAIILGYLPWLPTTLSHFSRPETDWLIPYNPNWLDRIAPLYQTLAGWTLMFIALPVERQPWPVTLTAAALMIIFMIGLGWRVWIGWRQLWSQPTYRPVLVLLLGFTLCVLAEFMAIAYLLDKDLTVVPRYNFVYYPGLCALVSASLAGPFLAASGSVQRARRYGAIVFLAGLLSSVLVVNGWVFLKSFTPDRVAQTMHLEPDQSTAMVVAYDSLQQVALGLSFALELRKLEASSQPHTQPPIQFAFVDKTAGYLQTWKRLAAMPQALPLPLNLWVVASPGMRTEDYPDRLRVSYPARPNRQGRVLCAIDPTHYHRVGFPYQLFRCVAKEKR